jgi:hypothetical protein
LTLFSFRASVLTDITLGWFAGQVQPERVPRLTAAIAAIKLEIEK